jgi:hypothetical protein
MSGQRQPDTGEAQANREQCRSADPEFLRSIASVSNSLLGAMENVGLRGLPWTLGANTQGA